MATNVTVEEYLSGTLTGQHYNLRDTGAAIAALTPEQLAGLVATHIENINATDDVLTLTVEQYLALEPFLKNGIDWQINFTGNDVVTIADESAHLTSLTLDQLSALLSNRVDAISPTDGTLIVSWAQFSAIDHSLLSGVTSMTLLDTRANIEGLDIGSLEGLGFTGIDSLNDFLVLTQAQYESLGNVVLTAADEVRVDADGDYTLGDDVDNLLLTGTDNWNGTGNAFDNNLTGNDGNNTLDGAGGNDTLRGGLGDDTYITDGGDIIREKVDAGNDTVISSVTYKLGNNVENLTLTGTDNLNARGNELNNTIIGNDGDNRILGGQGQDMMTGGLGADKFLFGVSATSDDVLLADHVEDFSSAEGDKLVVGLMDADVTSDASLFTFIGSDDFSSTAGELRSVAGVEEGSYEVSGDTNGDGTADFVIVVHSATALVETDFIL